jgi:hypothetical protein
MDAFQIEEKRQKLINFLSQAHSSRSKLFLISAYFHTLLHCKDQSLMRAFLPEFLKQYTDLLNVYTPFGLPPERTKFLSLQAEEITHHCSEDESKILIPILLNIKHKSERLNRVLRGETFTCQNHLNVPLLDISDEKEQQHSGLLETIHIEISAANEQRFILIPTMDRVEQRLQQQIELSWHLACEYVNRYIKHIKKHHRVLIQLEQSGVYYSGDSLGTALAVGFIEQLFRFYHAAYQLHFQPGIATTGGLDKKGFIQTLGEKTMTEKVEVVFYSPIALFIVPQQDMEAAKRHLAGMKTAYPARNLELISITDLNDLLDRRRVIAFKKISLYRRSIRLMTSSKVSAVLLLLLLSLVSFYLLRFLDNNPAELVHREKYLIIENKYSRMLWKLERHNYEAQINNQYYIPSTEKMIDVNHDGMNEILICNEPAESLTDPTAQMGRIVCLDYNKNELWSYNFKDTVSTNVEKHNTFYLTALIDTITLNGKQQLLCRANNNPYYPSVLYKLDPVTGQRLSGAFWHAGSIIDAFMIHPARSNRILVSAFNNAFDRVVITMINPDSLLGQCPSTLPYRFKVIRQINPEYYIFLPRSDLNRYYKWRSNMINAGSLLFDKHLNKITVATVEHTSTEAIFIGYQISIDFSNIDITFSNQFVFIRDQLVREGKLNPPLTETPEYRQIILNDFYEWDGSKMVPLIYKQERH